MLGWSDGGITAMILAAKYPLNVHKCVVWGSNAYVLKEELETYKSEFSFPSTITIKLAISLYFSHGWKNFACHRNSRHQYMVRKNASSTCRIVW